MINLSGKASTKGASTTTVAKYPLEKRPWRQSIRQNCSTTAKASATARDNDHQSGNAYADGGQRSQQQKICQRGETKATIAAKHPLHRSNWLRQHQLTTGQTKAKSSMKHDQALHSKEQLQARRRNEQAWQVPPTMPFEKGTDVRRRHHR
jgi:hypothetical protein